MRRAKGTGSVIRLSGNRRCPWQSRLTIGWQDGKQLFKTIGFYATKAEAEMAIAQDRLLPTAQNANISWQGLFEQWKQTRAYTDISKQA